MDIQIIKGRVGNCYIIKHEGTILVDAGMPGEFNKFSKRLKAIGIDPKEIKAIVITHCHWDHIGCTKKIKDMTGAKVVVQEYEKDILVKGEMTMPPSVTRWGKILAALLKGWSKKFSIEPSEVDIVIGEEDYSLEEFGIKGKIVFTPGHSPGSISVVLDSGEAFVGDMAMNGLPLTIGPNLPIFAEDMPALKNSWRKLIDKGAKKIYPAHGRPFPIEKLMKKVVL
ncbi:MAG: MBL fold metallo-hydrolase [Syntrophobacterales bacterium]|nr:MBL fold metallo-hydrolase [Syntrophobacterales bacterium]